MIPTAEVYDHGPPPTTVASFSSVILIRLISISIGAFHHVSQLQTGFVCGYTGY